MLSCNTNVFFHPEFIFFPPFFCPCFKDLLSPLIFRLLKRNVLNCLNRCVHMAAFKKLKIPWCYFRADQVMRHTDRRRNQCDSSNMFQLNCVHFSCISTHWKPLTTHDDLSSREANGFKHFWQQNIFSLK